MSADWKLKFQEGKTGVIQLREDKLEALKRMLSYLYTYDYEDEDGLGPFNVKRSLSDTRLEPKADLI